MKRLFTLLFTLSIIVGVTGMVYAWTRLAVVEDPLVRMPGTQPGQTALEAPGRCLNCHGGYDTAVEPGFNWKGSMMAQSARDFLFWACFTVSAQDSIWAVGRPNATDICERCHFPQGWLEGRSDPTNASLMTGADFDGVQCDFCHTMYDPFFETTYWAAREGHDVDINKDGNIDLQDWALYWDETNASGTPSQPAADATYVEDATQAQAINIFIGSPFFDLFNEPPENYLENGSGQYFVSTGSQKRASFADAAARHQMFYSRYHKSKYFCDTCHDVSNPILANLGADPTQPLPTELNSASSYFHVERTFSEFMLSDYGQPGGAATNPEFQAQGAPDILHVTKCQDCHMRDVVGVACNKKGVPVRPDESVEHPQSGQPLHDLTGGNAWVSWVLASAIPGSPNYDSVNDGLLNQGAAVLTLDLTQGEGIDPVALLAGVDRAKQQLLLAATIKNPTYDPATGALSFEVQNNTPHKLISGFPEGRRMFVNIKAYSGGDLIYEVNPYEGDDPGEENGAHTLKGLDYPYLGQGLPGPEPLAGNEAYVDELVYEMKPSSNAEVPSTQGVGLTGEAKTFHFPLATGRYKDNRIPPRGFDAAKAPLRHSETVYTTLVGGIYDDIGSTYYVSAEYAGGYDDVSLTIPIGANYVEVNLYYQTTSREYIEFLRDEIRGEIAGNLTLPDPDPGTPAVNEAYIVQTDPFFSQLKAWGDTIWNLWTHNVNVDGAAPFLMTSAAVGAPPTGCTAPTPTLLSATPGQKEVTLAWSDESADPTVAGYRVYYDQAGKSQLVAEIPLGSLVYDALGNVTYVDTGLTDGVEYCYKVTSYYDPACESGFSDILCATPNPQGQTGPSVGVVTAPPPENEMKAGYWSGKGKNQTWQDSPIPAGETVVIRALVLGQDPANPENLIPISNATVEIVIGGPETVTLNSGPSGADGWAEATWNTQKPNKRGQGGTATGGYTATTTNVTATGYNWDGVTTSTTFTIQ